MIIVLGPNSSPNRPQITGFAFPSVYQLSRVCSELSCIFGRTIKRQQPPPKTPFLNSLCSLSSADASRDFYFWNSNCISPLLSLSKTCWNTLYFCPDVVKMKANSIWKIPSCHHCVKVQLWSASFGPIFFFGLKFIRFLSFFAHSILPKVPWEYLTLLKNDSKCRIWIF